MHFKLYCAHVINPSHKPLPGKYTQKEIITHISLHHLLLGNWNVLFKKRFAIRSFLWHNTLSIVLGSDLFHLPVVGGIGSFLPDVGTPIPLFSQAAVVKSSMSCSLDCPMS
uniref:Uncharacterized protein n=1 Tax=Opuntia streptacantha TaxID=393608 RepID=A0A7C8YH28_OPUST